MTGRKEFNQVLGRIITDRPFGDSFLRDQKEVAGFSWGVGLTPQELAMLAKLKSQDVLQIRMALGV
jgi:uncharacterized protein YcsI (UPF0317 family)